MPASCRHLYTIFTTEGPHAHVMHSRLALKLKLKWLSIICWHMPQIPRCAASTACISADHRRTHLIVSPNRLHQMLEFGKKHPPTSIYLLPPSNHLARALNSHINIASQQMGHHLSDAEEQ